MGQIGLLSNLRVLNLDYSGFEGFLPSQIGQLTLLQSLLVRGRNQPKVDATNRVSGTLPTEFGNLKQLRTLGISNNLISGTIPPEIGGMESLRRFEVEENKL